MASLEKKYSKEQFVIVTINVDNDKNDATVFLEQFSLNSTTIFDTDNAIAKSYNIKAMPSAFVYDKEGTLVLTTKGFNNIKRQKIEKTIESLLSEN
jgi:thioredoxin-related protein